MQGMIFQPQNSSVGAVADSEVMNALQTTTFHNSPLAARKNPSVPGKNSHFISLGDVRRCPVYNFFPCSRSKENSGKI